MFFTFNTGAFADLRIGKASTQGFTSMPNAAKRSRPSMRSSTFR